MTSIRAGSKNSRALLTYLCAIVIGSLTGAQAADWPEFGGPNRNAISSETGLLKEWPEGGPQLLWSAEGIGAGFSSAVIANGTVYVTGQVGEQEALTAFDLAGKQKWQVPYGGVSDKWPKDARSTPTVEGDSVYVISGAGVVACLDAASGLAKWSVEARNEFGGKPGNWTTAECPLLVDDKVIYTPAGDQTTVVALNKSTGKTVWTSAPVNDASAYVSPICIERGGKQQIIAVTAKWILGVDAADGKILWKVEYGKLANAEKANGINCCSPVYHDGKVYVTAGYDHGSVQLQLSEDGTEAKVVWEDQTLDCHHGGVVLLDGYLYGANWINNGTGNWICLDWNTGQVKYDKS